MYSGKVINGTIRAFIVNTLSVLIFCTDINIDFLILKRFKLKYEFATMIKLQSKVE